MSRVIHDIDFDIAYFDIVVNLLNMMIVTKSKSLDPFTGADHRVFTSIFHLLIYLGKGCDGLARRLEQHTSNFFHERYYRHKLRTEDLGEFLIKSSLFSRMTWSELGRVVVEEAMIRFVRTFVGVDEELEILPSMLAPDDYVNRAFKATKTNREVIAMHCLIFKFHSDLQTGECTLDDCFGVPDDKIIVELKKKWSRVQSMSNFEDFFGIVELEPPPNMFIYLTHAVRQSSEDAGYHTRSHPPGRSARFPGRS